MLVASALCLSGRKVAIVVSKIIAIEAVEDEPGKCVVRVPGDQYLLDYPFNRLKAVMLAAMQSAVVPCE